MTPAQVARLLDRIKRVIADGLTDSDRVELDDETELMLEQIVGELLSAYDLVELPGDVEARDEMAAMVPAGIFGSSMNTTKGQT